MTREERLKLIPPEQSHYQRYRAWVDDGGLHHVAGLFVMAVCSTLLGGFSLGFFLTNYQQRMTSEIVTIQHVIDHHQESRRKDYPQ